MRPCGQVPGHGAGPKTNDNPGYRQTLAEFARAPERTPDAGQPRVHDLEAETLADERGKQLGRLLRSRDRIAGSGHRQRLILVQCSQVGDSSVNADRAHGGDTPHVPIRGSLHHIEHAVNADPQVFDEAVGSDPRRGQMDDAGSSPGQRS